MSVTSSSTFLSLGSPFTMCTVIVMYPLRSLFKSRWALAGSLDSASVLISSFTSHVTTSSAISPWSAGPPNGTR